MTRYPMDARRGAKAATNGTRRLGALARARCAFASTKGWLAAAVFISAATFACSAAPSADVHDGKDPLDTVLSANDASMPPISADDGASDASVGLPDAPDAGSYESNAGDFAIDVADVMARYEPAYPVTRALTVFASKLEIHLVDYVGRCADEATDTLRGNTKFVSIVIEHRAHSAADAALRPGTYKFGTGPDDAVIELGAIAPNTCDRTTTSLPVDPLAATKNELVITTLTETHVAGTFEMTTSDGKFLKGAFDTDLCTTSWFSSTPVCK